MSKLFIFTVTIILGAVVGEPLRSGIDNDVIYSEKPNYELAKTDAFSLVELLCGLIGVKTSAISIAVTLLEWVVSNFYVILLGSAGVLGFCKLTGKCTLDYEQYIPISQIQSYATPENLESAERLLITAVEKYADMRKREV